MPAPVGGKRSTWDPDYGGEGVFPASLLESALGSEDHSPTKRIRGVGSNGAKKASTKRKVRPPRPLGAGAQRGKKAGSAASASEASTISVVTPCEPSTSLTGGGEAFEAQDNFGDNHDVPGVPSHGQPEDELDQPNAPRLNSIAAYIDAVNSGVAGFKLIYGRLFVVQGWDVERRQTKDTWHHLQYQQVGDGITTGCSCPLATRGLSCIHQRYFLEANLAERYGSNVSTDDPPAAKLFYQRPLTTVSFLSLFSVESKSSSALKGRAIVSHIGSSRAGGTWKCSKDTNLTSCSHINEASHLLPEEFGDLLEGLDLMEEAIAEDVCTMERGPGSTVSHLPIHVPKWTALPTDPVLYRESPPLRDLGVEPLTFRLQEGDSCGLCPFGRAFYDRSRGESPVKAKLYTLTGLFEVQIEVQKCPLCPPKSVRCIGPDLRNHGIFNYNNSVLVSHELLNEYTSAYTSSETPFIAWTTQLSRRYDLCDTKFMGPDLFRAVWFSFAFLQDFRDDMTCTTCGPAPDTVIWDGITLSFGKRHLTNSLRPPTLTTHAESQVRNLTKYRPKQQLLPDRSLRKAVRDALHGPSVAALRASAKEEGLVEQPVASPLLDISTIQPFGATSPSCLPPFGAASPSRPPHFGVTSSSHPAPITTPIFRTGALFRTSSQSDGPVSIVAPPSTPIRSSAVSTSQPCPSTIQSAGSIARRLASGGSRQPVVAASPSPSKSLLRQAGLIDKHLKSLSSVTSSLRAQCSSLGDLFETYLGEQAYAERPCPKIAAEESALQLVNYASWLEVRNFLSDPIPKNTYLVLSVPAFFRVLELKDVDREKVVDVLRWVETHVRNLLKEMINEEPLKLAREGSIPSGLDDWRKASSILHAIGMPIIRHRPYYPNLDQAKLKKEEEKLQEMAGKRGDRCGKYYSQYGERRLTGGIMVAWCTHSICYGFHCIPSSEGRDDVFSAMVTRWPVAPKRVVYDFACALGPYCMLREPQFFGNTYFAIDHFHANGHTKCSPAAFLSEYSNVDPTLSAINSSAAECGNGALRRIRKSVSYMGQERAIIYTKVFLSVWNRLKLRRMAAERLKNTSMDFD